MQCEKHTEKAVLENTGIKDQQGKGSPRRLRMRSREAGGRPEEGAALEGRSGQSQGMAVMHKLWRRRGRRGPWFPWCWGGAGGREGAALFSSEAWVGPSVLGLVSGLPGCHLGTHEDQQVCQLR